MRIFKLFLNTNKKYYKCFESLVEQTYPIKLWFSSYYILYAKPNKISAQTSEINNTLYKLVE